MKIKLSLFSVFFLFSNIANGATYNRKDVCSELTHTFPPLTYYHLTSSTAVVSGELYYWNGNQCSYQNSTIHSSKDVDVYGSVGQSLSYQCPIGTTRSSNGVCTAIDLSQYNNDFSGCLSAGGTVTNMHFDSNAPFGFGFDCSATNASILALPTYQKPEDCDANGGYVMLSGGAYKCGTLGDVFGEIITNALGMVPAFGLFKSNKLKGMAQSAVLDKFKQLAFNPSKPDHIPNVHVDLPRLPSPSAAQGGAKATTPVNDTPPPTNSSGHVKSQPEVTIDTAYSHLSDTYIPVKPSGDPVIDYAVVDRVNTINKISTSPSLSEVIPQTGTTQKPVKETFDFSKIIANSAEPSTIANVPQTTTRTTTYSGTQPIEVVTVTKTYPDGSSSLDVYKINTATSEAVLESTTLSPDGETSTIFKPIPLTDVTVTPTGITGTIETSPNPVPDVDVTTTPPETTATSNNPDAISNQSLDTLINAKMPDYSVPKTGDFALFDSNPISEMVEGFDDLFSNVRNQLETTHTVFTQTKDLISGSWTPPQIPAGSCGSSMSFDVFGRHVDLCPPLADFSSSYSPLFSALVSIAGIALAVSIFLGGM